jgi:hypothetical protein
MAEGSPWACRWLGATPWHRGGSAGSGQAGLSSRYTLSSAATTQACAAWCSWRSALLVLDGRRWLQLLDDDDVNVQLQLPSSPPSPLPLDWWLRDGLGLSPMAATVDRRKRVRPIL